MGSGAALLQILHASLEFNGWTVLTTDRKEFTHFAIPPDEAILAEARRLNATYVLYVVLGEFRDTAPMTFRTDFVTLQSARLWRADSGSVVWALPEPMMFSGNNLQHYQRFFDDISKLIVRSITKSP